MKKILLIEAAVLAVVLLIAVLVATGVIGPASPTPTEPVTQPTEPPTEPTEPVVIIPTWNTYPADRQIKAKQYFVYDTKADTFLITSSQQLERVYPASVTKLFTAYVALQYLEPDRKITVDNVLDLIAAGSSVAGIRQGDTLTVERLVEAMLLPSGNDAAYILACEAGRIIKNDPLMYGYHAVRAFVEEMNVQAKALGMVATHFVNPDGIHSQEHYSTFGDLAIMGKLALANPIVMQYATTAKDQIYLHGVVIDWKNTNSLINPDSKYYCPYAVGLKTGQTPSAGSCLLSAFRVGNRELIIGVFGSPSGNDRFDDTLQLFNQIVLN